LSRQNRGERTKPILEINLQHPLVAAIAKAGTIKAGTIKAGTIKAETGPATVDDLSLLLLEEAQILDGELPDDPAAFAARLNRLVLQGIT
jgi:molecular chaperone HtpG